MWRWVVLVLVLGCGSVTAPCESKDVDLLLLDGAAARYLTEMQASGWDCRSLGRYSNTWGQPIGETYRCTRCP